LAKKNQKKGKLQQLKGIIKKITNFLGRRHIWSGLIAGFLWAFSAPFVLTVFSSFFDNLPKEAIWTLFFPLKLSFTLMSWMSSPETIDALSVWMASILIGMFLGVVFTYSIHRIRVWRRTHNIPRTIPSK
jgi:hypothetical protein